MSVLSEIFTNVQSYKEFCKQRNIFAFFVEKHKKKCIFVVMGCYPCHIEAEC